MDLKSLCYSLVFLLLFSNEAYCQSSESSSFSFVFMTDVHLKNDSLVLKSYNTAIRKINVLNPDFVLSGGDQVFDVMRGNESKSDSLFQLFVTESKKINAPLYTAVGNHELFGIYEVSPNDSTHQYYKLGMYQKYFGRPYYSFRYNGWHFVVLNSLDVNGYKYISSFDKEQLAWLKKDLQSISPQTPVVVVSHVPIVSIQNQIQRPQDDVSIGPSLVNKYELLDILKPYNLKVVLQGHIHYFEDILVEGKTHYISGGAIAGRPSWKGIKNGPRGFLYFEVKDDKFNYSFIDYENDIQTRY